MVASTGPSHCAGIDLRSGALVRALSPRAVDQRLRPYDLVEVTVAPDLGDAPDPCEPETVAIDGAPALVGRRTGRPAQRLIRALLHPDKTPLLGFRGPTVTYWERAPGQPSVAVAEPQGPLMVTLDGNGMRCHFIWGKRPQVLACKDPRLAATLQRAGRDCAQMRTGTYLVIALEPPVGGLCDKVVEALIPRR
jgi:hypothetical protein